jgi:hypothetical protein
MAVDDSKEEQTSSGNSALKLTHLSQQRTASIERSIRAIEEMQLQLEAVAKQESKNEKSQAPAPTVHYHSLHNPAQLRDIKAQHPLQQSQSSPVLRPTTNSNHNSPQLASRYLAHSSPNFLALNSNNGSSNALPWLRPLNEFMGPENITPIAPQRVFSEPPAPLTALPSIEDPLTDFVGTAGSNAPSLMDFMRSVHGKSSSSQQHHGHGHGHHQNSSIRMMMDTEHVPKNYNSQNNNNNSLSLANNVAGVRSTSGTLQSSSSLFD